MTAAKRPLCGGCGEVDRARDEEATGKQRYAWARQYEPPFLCPDVSFSALPSAYSCATDWSDRGEAQLCRLKSGPFQPLQLQPLKSAEREHRCAAFVEATKNAPAMFA